MLQSAMFVGLGLVAMWAYCRYPSLRPRSLVRAVAQVIISFVGFALVPITLGFVLPIAPSPDLRRCLALAFLIPTLTYVLLTWVWLLARILHDLSGGTPRGGHPAATEP